MTDEHLNIQNRTEEYKRTIVNHKDGSRAIDWNAIEEILIADHDWTKEGAFCLANLVRNYGSFFLSNAYALSIALDQEDGELGF